MKTNRRRNIRVGGAHRSLHKNISGLFKKKFIYLSGTMNKNINLRGEGIHCAGFSYQLISICKSPSLQAGRHDAKSEIQIMSKVLDTN